MIVQSYLIFMVLCNNLKELRLHFTKKKKINVRLTFRVRVPHIEEVIDRPTQTPLCGFTVAARKPLKFCSNEHVFERFTFFV